ncbi:Calbindin-32 [Nymphon striatum]|nr:Calbindin-32 [Nymphon striatum]
MGVSEDDNGMIENEELTGFLKDLLELVKKFETNDKDYDSADLSEFKKAILDGCDIENSSGKIRKNDLTMILMALARHAQEEESIIETVYTMKNQNFQFQKKKKKEGKCKLITYVPIGSFRLNPRLCLDLTRSSRSSSPNWDDLSNPRYEYFNVFLLQLKT